MTAPSVLAVEAMAPSLLPRIAALLRQAALPSEGIAASQCRFWQIGNGDAPRAVAAVEFYGAQGLLRSVLVDAAERRKGLGRKIVAGVLDEARRLGVREVYLLTTSAADFFATLGFRTIERAGVPSDIAATAEFATLCPANAVCMTKTLG
jgi:amino-acid N-acetyltransferase